MILYHGLRPVVKVQFRFPVVEFNHLLIEIIIKIFIFAKSPRFGDTKFLTNGGGFIKKVD
jgi:hypothetical protein